MIMTQNQQNDFVKASLNGTLNAWGRRHQAAKRQRQRLYTALKWVGVTAGLSGLFFLWLYLATNPTTF